MDRIAIHQWVEVYQGCAGAHLELGEEELRPCPKAPQTLKRKSAV